MTDFFDRVLARAGCPPPEADVVQARPRGPEPFEGEGAGGRLPVLDETTLAPPSPSRAGGPAEVADPFLTPHPVSSEPGVAAVAFGSPSAARESATGDRIERRPLTDVETRPGGTVSVHERIETHELRTETVRAELVSAADQPTAPPAPLLAAPSRPRPRVSSVPPPAERGERAAGRRERQRPPEPVIEVRIGRIEVVAAAEPAEVRRRSRPEPRVSLDDYLSAAP